MPVTAQFWGSLRALLKEDNCTEPAVAPNLAASQHDMICYMIISP
jgi:hypothetical protein